MRVWGAAVAVLCALPLRAEVVTSARFLEPTQRYQHAVLGDDVEWGALEVTTSNKAGNSSLRLNAVARDSIHVFRLPLDHVFEDVEPRLWDVDGDGLPEVVVVETDVSQGAALAIYGPKGKITETPHIGTRNRWLAPIGAADMDGDGRIEVAYVDRPHLAKTIRMWRFEDGALTLVASAAGFTNHRIGEDDIAGGMRLCGGTPEMIVALANWTRVVRVRFDGAEFSVADAGPHQGRGSFAAAQACN